MKKIYKAIIIDQGNGFCPVGGFIFDSKSGELFKILSLGRTIEGRTNAKRAKVAIIGMSECNQDDQSDCKIEVTL